MNILLSGASGLIGTACRLELRRAGHEVMALSRDGAGSGIPWEVESGRLFLGDFVPDALIHLAGESIVSGKWTEARKQSIRASRVEATRKLADWFSIQPRKPRVVLSASAVGIFGNRGDKWLIESSPPSSEFLGQLCFDWERAMQPLERCGSRVVSMRFGMVLSPDGGVLGKMLPFFKWGLGGPLGDGNQWMSWITLDDVVRAIFFLLENENVSGPVNITSPNPVTNREFTTTLAKVLHRPSFLSIPGSVLHMLYGEMAEEALLASQRVRPLNLEERAFQWGYPELEPALTAMLPRK